MNDDTFLERERPAGREGKQARSAPYTAKDFQLEVLGQLSEMQELTEALQESFAHEHEQN